MPLQETSGNVTTDAYGGGIAAVPNYIENVFSTYLYTGNASTQTITNGIDLAGKGGLVWLKTRNQAYSNTLYDTARGVNKLLFSDNTDAQFSSSGYLTNFGSTGFTVGANENTNFSTSNTAVSWTFRKQPKFFDVVTYTGNGATSQTIAHNLQSKPGCVIIKRTDSTGSWWTICRDGTNTVVCGNVTSPYQPFALNSTNAAYASGVSDSFFFDSSSFFPYYFAGAGTDGTNVSGATYVAYLFAHNAGGFGLTGTDNVISCGTFTTDSGGNATVNLGYEAQWVLFKPVTGGTNWELYDTMRGASYSGAQYLAANSSAAEGASGSSYYPMLPTATGFTTKGWYNSSTLIYIAIRRGPMKVPTDATKVHTTIVRTGTSANATVTGASFPPDLVFPDEYNAGGTGAATFNRLIGPNKYTVTYSTATEVTETASLLSYNMNGFSVGADNTGNGQINLSPQKYANWLFGRAPSFFDTVCYTGSGTVTTRNHNLTVIPELVIIKSRSAVNGWSVACRVNATDYVRSLPGTGTPFRLNSTNASTQTVDLITGGQMAATTFVPYVLYGTSNDSEQGGVNYIAYLFASCTGVSKVGSYTGTGTLTTINCGFAAGARWLLIKRTDTSAGWYVWDSGRGMTAGTDPSLQLQGNNAQVNANSVYSITSGFQLLASPSADVNTNGGTYIYLAIA